MTVNLSAGTSISTENSRSIEGSVHGVVVSVILDNPLQPARLKVRSANMAELKRSRLAEHLKSITSAPCQMFRLAALFVANELDADMLVGTGSPRTARAMAASSRPTISSSSASVTTVGGQIRA